MGKREKETTENTLKVPDRAQLIELGFVGSVSILQQGISC